MNRSPLKFFLLVFALSIPFWLIQPRDWPIAASVGAPLIAALIMVYKEEGAGGVRRLLSRVFDQWRIRKKIWYVPIIFLMPLLYLLTYWVMRLMGLQIPGQTASFVMIPLLFVLYFALAIGEEVGWMGYAVDPMQERWSALTTAIILGVVSGIGHAPSLVQEDFSLTYIAVGLPLTAIGFRILFVWIYNNTGRSLFAVIVFHAMSNVSSAFISTVAGIPLIAITVVIVTFLWGSKTLARYRYA
jgi:membrane protease YdiL (CAAX protease family)